MKINVVMGILQEEECKLATQLKTVVMPIKQTQVRPKARVITEEEKKFSAYTALRKVGLPLCFSMQHCKILTVL